MDFVYTALREFRAVKPSEIVNVSNMYERSLLTANRQK